MSQNQPKARSSKPGQHGLKGVALSLALAATAITGTPASARERNDINSTPTTYSLSGTVYVDGHFQELDIPLARYVSPQQQQLAQAVAVEVEGCLRDITALYNPSRHGTNAQFRDAMNSLIASGEYRCNPSQTEASTGFTVTHELMYYQLVQPEDGGPLMPYGHVRQTINFGDIEVSTNVTCNTFGRFCDGKKLGSWESWMLYRGSESGFNILAGDGNRQYPLGQMNVFPAPGQMPHPLQEAYRSLPDTRNGAATPRHP